jgi:hypothetical protein
MHRLFQYRQHIGLSAESEEGEATAPIDVAEGISNRLLASVRRVIRSNDPHFEWACRVCSCARKVDPNTQDWLGAV